MSYDGQSLLSLFERVRVYELERLEALHCELQAKLPDGWTSDHAHGEIVVLPPEQVNGRFYIRPNVPRGFFVAFYNHQLKACNKRNQFDVHPETAKRLIHWMLREAHDPLNRLRSAQYSAPN